MTRAELDAVIGWAAAEGWNPGHGDAEAFRATDPGRFLLSLHEGEPAAAISAVRYGPSFGFIGLHLCRPELRGRGYGRAVWETAMAAYGRRIVGLDGVIAQQATYATAGFNFAHRTIRFGGVLPPGIGGHPSLIDAAGPVVGERVAAYDASFFPGPRMQFVRRWMAPPRVALAAISEGGIAGYGAIRPCSTGHKIGPLFADNPATADRLFMGLANRAMVGPVFIDVPEPNRAGTALAERYGLKPVFETARMYRGGAPSLPLNNVFGFTTLELG